MVINKEYVPKNCNVDLDAYVDNKPLSDSDDTLFIFIVRDPLNWLKSMKRMPYHALHLKKLPFSSFIRSEWTSYDNNKRIIEKCDNICSLRKEKINHFLDLKNRVKNFFVIRTNFLVDDINEMIKKFNLEMRYDELDMLDYGYSYGSKRSKRLNIKRSFPRKYDVNNIDESDIEFIKENLDMKIEKSLGFVDENDDFIFQE